MSGNVLTQSYLAIVIGASAGGTDALMRLLNGLTTSAALIIVQHCSEDAESGLLDLLNRTTTNQVRFAEDKCPIEQGAIYLAPPGYHTYVELDHTLSLSLEPPWNYSRPSIDVLFESAANAYRNGLIGIVLTGANSDGSVGLKKIKACGGLTVVQDPADATVPIMPQAAMDATKVDKVLSLSEIQAFINSLSSSEDMKSGQ